MMTSETSPGSTRARSRAAVMASAPRRGAGMLARAPLKAPTGVRAAPAITIEDASFVMGWALQGSGREFGGLERVGVSLAHIRLFKAPPRSLTSPDTGNRTGSPRHPATQPCK